MKMFEVIERPIISEKATALAEVANRYVFKVSSESSKPEIKDAIQKIFKVKVERVRTMNVHGKSKKFGRNVVRNPMWKKAIVTVAPGEKIEFFQAK